jgi:hypothetical protein
MFPKAKKQIVITLKVLIGLGVLFIIFFRLKNFSYQHLPNFKQLLYSNKNIHWLILSFCLMPVNWGLESIKWHLSKQVFQKSKITEAIQEVLAGISVSIFTPNRNGEFIGRIGLINSENRAKAIELYFVSSLTQQFFTFLFGLFSLIIIDMPFKNFALIGLLLLVLLLVSLKNIFPFFARWLSNYLPVRLIINLPKGLIFRLLILSGIRYIIFWLQFFFLFVGLNVQASLFWIIITIPAIFFIGSYIPSFALAEMGVKSLVAIYCLKNITSNETSIIIASALIWLINVALPALLGLYPLLKWKNNT